MINPKKNYISEQIENDHDLSTIWNVPTRYYGNIVDK